MWTKCIFERFSSKREFPFPRVDTIWLRALEEEWSVRYEPTRSPSVRVSDTHSGCLCLFGLINSQEACQKALLRWLSRKGKDCLIPWLEVVSKETQLPFQGFSVRNQRTRWGSCSQNGRISLNQQLLFLPGFLVEYVLIHELCHTVHLNHSREFWALVNCFEPKYRFFDKELRKARQYIPKWCY